VALPLRQTRLAGIGPAGQDGSGAATKGLAVIRHVVGADRNDLLLPVGVTADGLEHTG